MFKMHLSNNAVRRVRFAICTGVVIFLPVAAEIFVSFDVYNLT